MRRKLYNQLLKDAVHANEGFSEKQTAALNKAIELFAEGNAKTVVKLEEVELSIKDLFDYLDENEKLKLYNLCEPIGIKDLNPEEQLLLCSILNRLAVDSGEPNDKQSKYISNIYRYLGIVDAETAENYSAIGNIDSSKHKKVFLRVVFEYLYLQDGDEINEQHEEIFEYFGFNDTVIASVEFVVIQDFNNRKAEGIADKYAVICPENTTRCSADISDEAVEDIVESGKTFNDDCIDIPLEIADKIYFSGLYDNIYETKNYFIYCDKVDCHNKKENHWIRVSKKDKSCYRLTSLPVIYVAHGRRPFDCLKTTDYENDTVYYFNDGLLHKKSLSEDTDFVYENIHYEPNDSIMCYCDNSIVIIDLIKALHVDLINGDVSDIKDASGKTFPSQTAWTIVPLGDEILFYFGEDGAKLTGTDGSGLKDSLCSFNVKDSSIKCVLKLSEFEGSPRYISKLFVKNNELYAVCHCEGDRYALYRLNLKEKTAYVCKLQGNNWFDSYDLNKDYFVCVYEKDNKIFPICAFDFENNEFVEITSEGYRINRANFGKEEYSHPSISLIGQWLYYSQRIDKPKYTVIKQNKYRINLSSESKNPTLISEYKK